MFTSKRTGLQGKGPSVSQDGKQGFQRLMDFFRLQYPLKFDFCRMRFDELKKMVDAVIRKGQEDPTSFQPVVAIGHTKDLVDFETVGAFLSYLNKKGIKVSTFEEVYEKCK